MFAILKQPLYNCGILSLPTAKNRKNGVYLIAFHHNRFVCFICLK